MALESLENRINIKDLSLEVSDQEAELSFDIEREVTESDWKIMLTELDKLAQEKHWEIFLKQAAYMISALPESQHANEVREKYYTNDQQILRKLQDYENDLDKYSIFCEYLKYIMPKSDLASQPDLDMWGHLKNNFSDSTIVPMQRFSARSLLEQGVRMKLLFPEDEKEFQVINNFKDNTGLIDKELNEFRTKNRWASLARLASRAALLLPKQTYSPNITQKDWTEMKGTWEVMKSTIVPISKSFDWGDYMQMASDMKYLTAKKIEIIDGKIEAEYPDSSEIVTKQPNNSLPEQRKF